MSQESLLDIIYREIEESPQQAIPFARFMELALYHPRWGYYQQERPKLGKEGDFFTNAHVGSIYGRVLARYFAKLVRSMGNDQSWTIVEMGAGEGQLAEQFITGLLELGINLSELRFYIVEISGYHRQVQQQRLVHLPISCQWVSRIGEIPVSSYSFVYSNELIDAFPIHRIKREQGKVLESYVAQNTDSDQLVEQWKALSTDEIKDFIIEMSYSLQEGQMAEVNLQAKKWIQELTAWIKSGLILTIDYGGKTVDLLQRLNGTIRGYQQHQLIDQILDRPGQIDLTSHVNFEALMRWGETLGLHTYFYQTQSQFLLQAGILDIYPIQAVSDPFSPEARQQRAIRQLIYPQAMGEAFQVLLQGKGLPIPLLS